MVEAWLIVAGTLAHELYSWTDENWLVGLFTPVNESIWEHLKLGYAASLTWMPFERWILRRHHSTMAFAVTLGLVILELTIVIVFFQVRPLTPPWMHLAVDIGSYVLGSLLMGQVIRHTCDLERRDLVLYGRIGLAVIALLFAILTIWPPPFYLFIDHSTR